jgi:hypothetical protein
MRGKRAQQRTAEDCAGPVVQEAQADREESREQRQESRDKRAERPVVSIALGQLCRKPRQSTRRIEKKNMKTAMY